MIYCGRSNTSWEAQRVDPVRLDKPLAPSPVVAAGALAFATNLILGLVKLWAGRGAGSTALVADAFDTLADGLKGAVVLGGLLIARRPPDHDHPYGHGKAESLAALVVGVLVAGAGVQIGWQALEALRQPEPLPPGAVALAAALLSVGVKGGLAAVLLRVGRQHRSPALEASGRDARADAVASLGVFAGVLGARLGWPGLDPLVGLVIALLVLRTGVAVTRGAVDELMDRVADPELIHRLTQAARSVGGCLAVEEIHPRAMGPYLVVDLVIGVPAHLTVQEGDRVAHRVEAAIRRGCPEVAQVMVHVNPVETHPSCLESVP